MDCIVHVVTKSRTQLSDFHFQGGESKVHNSKLSLLLFVASKSSLILRKPQIPIYMLVYAKILKTTSETVKKVVI